jgi:hypothetical protein
LSDEALSALVDGELPSGEATRAAEAIEQCEVCRANATELRALVTSIHGLEPVMLASPVGFEATAQVSRPWWLRFVARRGVPRTGPGRLRTLSGAVMLVLGGLWAVGTLVGAHPSGAGGRGTAVSTSQKSVTNNSHGPANAPASGSGASNGSATAGPAEGPVPGTGSTAAAGIAGAPGAGSAGSAAGSAPPKRPYAQGSQPAAGLADSNRVQRTAAVGLAVPRGQFDQAVDALQRLDSQMNGRMGQASLETTSDGSRQGSLTLEVPVDRFQATIDELRRRKDLESMKVDATDVTQQYVDLQARLRTEQAQEDAMVAVLHKATTVPDILSVQQQIGPIRTQIEELQARINLLDHTTMFSSITVNLRQAGPGNPASQVDLLGLRGAAGRAGQAFGDGVDWMVVALGTVAPFALVLAGLALIWWRPRLLSRFGASSG